MTFNNQMTKIFDFDDDQNINTLMRRIGGMRQGSRGTHLAEAMAWSYETFFAPNCEWVAGDEMPGRSVVVLISDGISNPRDDEILDRVLKVSTCILTKTKTCYNSCFIFLFFFNSVENLMHACKNFCFVSILALQRL